MSPARSRRTDAVTAHRGRGSRGRRSRRRWSVAACAAWISAASAVLAQAPIAVTHPECLPNEDSALLRAVIASDVGGRSVRLYFRRLSSDPEGEAFYYVEMLPAGGGEYWTTFPKPEDRPQLELTERWWEARSSDVPPPAGETPPPRWRNGDWPGRCDLEELRRWLRDWLEAPTTPAVCAARDAPASTAASAPETPETGSSPRATTALEAAEFYVAVYEADGEPLRGAGGEPLRSPVFLVAVRDDCPESPSTRLDARQRGWAANLTVGETSEEQRGSERTGKELFHWLCDGITARIGLDRIPRPDRHCRRCVIGDS